MVHVIPRDRSLDTGLGTGCNIGKSWICLKVKFYYVSSM